MTLRISLAFPWPAALLLVVPAVAAQQQPERAQGSVPENPVYDRLVDEFIQYDIGNIHDPASIARIRNWFVQLKDEAAVPALVRGLNQATRMRASCPITAISSKLRSILNASRNPELGTYVMQHLEKRDVGRYNRHLAHVFSSSEKQLLRTLGKRQLEQQWRLRVEQDKLRMVYVPGMKLTELAPRGPAAVQRAEAESDPRPATGDGRGAKAAGEDAGPSKPAEEPDLRELSDTQLAKLLEKVDAPELVVEELSRRAAAGQGSLSGEQLRPLLALLRDGEAPAREAVARLLGMHRIQAAVPELIEALEDGDPHVRSAVSTALARTTRQLFGPRDEATPAEVRQAVERWRRWWEQAKPAPLP